MKKNIYAIICLFAIVLSACQEDNNLGSNATGYLRLGLNVNTSSLSRAEEIYNPEQLAVYIVDSKGDTIQSTTNYDANWKGKSLELPIGHYTVMASSAGFDGATSAYDKPYYAGSTEVDIKSGTSSTAELECTLANVQVTVNYDQTFEDAFSQASVSVDDNTNNNAISPLEFVMGGDKKTGYFPVVELKSVVTVTNKNGVEHTQTDTIRNVKPRDHFILNYKVAEGTTGGDITIETDDSQTVYIYNISVHLTSEKEPALRVSANPWAKLAYLEGTVVDNGIDLSQGTFAFQYRVKNAEAWTSVAATLDGSTYKATVTGLTPATTYESRMVYGDETFVGDVKEFTTEAATALYNGGFDLWSNATIGSGLSKHDDVPYLIDPNEAIVYGTSGDKSPICFWDSGNAGAATMGEYPTTKFEENGSTGALLESKYVGMNLGFVKIGKFAAGNVYTGHYFYTDMGSMGAQIFFGQPFVSRPIQLKGRFKYTRGTNVDEGNDPYKSELQNSGGDQCGLYIVLTDNEGVESEGNKYAFEIDNTLSADAPDKFMYKNTIDFSESNPHIVAYGTISEAEAKGTGAWQEFTIDLKYRSLTRVPKYIIVVASASKYGDFFTGSTSSVMYVDDFELVYDGEPSVQE